MKYITLHDYGTTILAKPENVHPHSSALRYQLIGCTIIELYSIVSAAVVTSYTYPDLPDHPPLETIGTDQDFSN